jgi:hypothetical protein
MVAFGKTIKEYNISFLGLSIELIFGGLVGIACYT